MIGLQSSDSGQIEASTSVFTGTASTNISPELLRASTLRTALRGCGVFLRSKGDYPHKEALWECSFACNSIKSFLSHSWAASGSLKYISLLVHSSFTFGVFVGAVAFVLLSSLSALDILPALSRNLVSTFINVEYIIPISPWCVLFAPALTLVALFSSPSLNLPSQSVTVFLDMLCIHQVDSKRQKEGLRSLGGFLIHSDELIVLWSDSYFSRLWCVFELAAFRKFRPKQQIKFLPISLFGSYLIGYWMCFTGSVFSIFLLIGLGISRTITSLTVLPFFCVAIILLRQSMRDRLALHEQLLAFDCRTAACREHTDRKYILASLQSWFGTEEAFNLYIQGPLRMQVEKDMFDRPVTFKAMLFIAFPWLCCIFKIFAGYCRAGVPMHVLVRIFIIYCDGFFFVAPLAIWSTYYLAERFCKPRESRGADIVLCIALGFVPTCVFFCLGVLGSSLANVHLALCCLHVAIAGALSWLAFGKYPQLRARRLRGLSSSQSFDRSASQSLDFQSAAAPTELPPPAEPTLHPLPLSETSSLETKGLGQTAALGIVASALLSLEPAQKPPLESLVPVVRSTELHARHLLQL